MDPALSPQQISDWTRDHVLIAWSVQSQVAPLPIVRGEGTLMYTADGREILDFSCGLICTNLGHSHPRVVAAIREQAGRLQYVTPNFANDERARLARLLHEISPGRKLVQTLFTSGGAEANENAVKIARAYTGRHKVLTHYRSFHGATHLAGTMTGEQRRWPVETYVTAVKHFFGPYPYRSFFGVSAEEDTAMVLRALREVLRYEGPQNVAAIVVEPVIGSNGVIYPGDGYLQGLREICDEHGIVLVFDEVMTGFGRTGKMFASEHWGVVPDVMVFAKGVTSAYVPLGGVMINAAIAGFFADRMLWAGLTYQGPPLACAAGVAAIRAYQEEGLIERAATTGEYLGARLRTLADRHPTVGDVRGRGMFWAVELVKDRATREPLVPWNGPGQGVMAAINKSLLENGLYVFGRWNVLHVAPPLNVKEAEIDRAVAIMDSVLDLADQEAGLVPA
jgi:taurine--2-oxoglutarate transaminase